MKPMAPLMRSKIEARRFWKRWKVDFRVERMVVKMPLRISRKEERRFWRPDRRPIVMEFLEVGGWI